MTPKIIIIMLCSLTALLLVVAAAIKLKNRQSEYLAENYRLAHDNADLVTENIMLKGDQECLE